MKEKFPHGTRWIATGSCVFMGLLAGLWIDDLLRIAVGGPGLVLFRWLLPVGWGLASFAQHLSDWIEHNNRK